jgi:hypothetical protein
MSNLQIVNNGEIVPDLMRRSCGGWLAVAPKDGIFSIGVTAPTADEAREKFGTTIQCWLEILATAKNDVNTGT